MELILYYSFGGTTRKYAAALAEKRGAEICEITELKKRNIITAFIPGCVQSMKLKASQINPPEKKLGDYNKITILGPVWAGHPAPAVNAAAELLPEGKFVEVFLLSGSGESETEHIKELIEGRGCTVTAVNNVKSDDIN